MKNIDKKKTIGLYTLIGIGVGGVIGSGIFGLPAVMAALAGPSLILAILIAGFIAMLFALVYAELGSTYSVSGGPYAYPRLAMGNLLGFLIGWGYFIFLFVGTAAILDIFVIYLDYFIPGLAHNGILTFHGMVIALVFLWIYTFINIFGVQWGGLYSLISTILKLGAIGLFCILGFFYLKETNFIPFAPFGWTGVTLAIAMFFWAYTGLEAIVVPGEHIHNPSKTIPRAMIATILITMITYLLVALVFVGMLDWGGLHLKVKDWTAVTSLTSGLADAAKGVHSPFLVVIAIVGAIISTAGQGGTWVLIQGQLPYAMAKDGLFWKSMGEIHHKYFTPVQGLVVSSVLTSVIIIGFPDFAIVSLIASITVIVPYAMAMLALPILRKREPSLERPFKIPYVNVFCWAGFILATILIYWASWPWVLIGVFLLLTAYPASLFVKVKKDYKDSLWFLIYLIGIVIISYLGDERLSTSSLIEHSTLGYLPMPYDLIILCIFGTIIYMWAYKRYTKKLPI